MDDRGRSPAACVGVFCFRDRALLLIRRARAPNQGGWSVPGGRIEWGETAPAAALRELAEETGVTGEIAGLVEVYDAIHPDAQNAAFHFVIAEYAMRWVSGEPHPTDEALEAAFFPLDALDGLELTADLRRVAQAAARLMADATA